LGVIELGGELQSPAERLNVVIAGQRLPDTCAAAAEAVRVLSAEIATAPTAGQVVVVVRLL
jgi:hypothetical protein